MRLTKRSKFEFSRMRWDEVAVGGEAGVRGAGWSDGAMGVGNELATGALFIQHLADSRGNEEGWYGVDVGWADEWG